MIVSKEKDIKIVTDRAHFGGLITLDIKNADNPNKLYLQKNGKETLLNTH
jgi:hypothetical protein